MQENAYALYPSQGELADWIGQIWSDADKIPVKVEEVPDAGYWGSFGTFHLAPYVSIIRFTPEGMTPFYGCFHRVTNGPAPLAVHVPGYGAELSSHPDTLAHGFNLLTLSPLGYWTPTGFDMTLARDGNWPVLPDTIRTKAQGGYRSWLLNCVMAVKWAWTQSCVLPNRVSFYGTSQGGGGSLLLGSLFKDKGVRCVAADQPFLTDYPRADWRGAYYVCKAALDEAEDKNEAWHSLGFADTYNHAPRLTCPVLLTQGELDEVCPVDTIEALYKRLPLTKSLTWLSGRGHGYNVEFMHLVWAWLRLYA
ncbi:MAG: acetylxylan esterase [Eubacteriales bacterium]